MATLSKAEISERFIKFAELVRLGQFDGIKPETTWWLVNPNSYSQEKEQENDQDFVPIHVQLGISADNMKLHYKRYWAGDMGEKSF